MQAVSNLFFSAVAATIFAAPFICCAVLTVVTIQDIVECWRER